MTPSGAIDLIVASTLSVIAAVPVSTTMTPSLPDDTVMLPPAPTSIEMRPRTGRICTCPLVTDGIVGFHAHDGRAPCVSTRAGPAITASAASAAATNCHLQSATFCPLPPASCALLIAHAPRQALL